VSKPRAWAEPLAIVLRPIGVMRSPLVLHHEAPRQPRAQAVATEVGRDPKAPAAVVRGEIHIAEGLQNCLHDLGGFSHVWVLFVCHHTRGWNSKVMPPRDTQKRGVFATRAPARPNPIGLSCLQLLSVDKRVLQVGDHDILDGTPILDVKPYLPYCDSVPEASIGWVATLAGDARDHRDWWQQKDVAPPAVYRARQQKKRTPE
jgi:tRNA-Thr(GGU) m(6)t(6)A37 methyltransferase TsaA